MYLADWTHSCAKSGNHWIYHVQWHWGGHCSLFCSMDFAGTAISYLGSIYHCHQRSQCCWNASTEQSDSTHLSAEKKSEENEGKPRPQPCSHWTFTIFLSIYPPMTNWQPWKGQRWYFSYTIRPLLPRKKEKKPPPRWKETQTGNKWAIF